MKIWTEISRERLAGNFAALQTVLKKASGAMRLTAPEGKVAPPASLLAVVKANAYGHGIDPCAAVLAGAGAEWLGVTDAQEGARVRAALGAAGFAVQSQPKVLVMCGTVGLAGEAENIVRNGLTAVVWNAGHVQRLAAAALAAGISTPLGVHLEIDSGMSRQGAAPGTALDAALAAIHNDALIELDGVFTHFAATEVAGSPQTAAQQAVFRAAVEQVRAAGLTPQWIHVGNSSYIDNDAAGTDSIPWLRALAARVGARSMVRSGLALYGYVLPIAGEGRSRVTAKVLPVMTWKTRVIGVSDVAAGALIGYNGTFRAQRSMRLALLPVGYADGLRRELSASNERPGGWVMLHGRRAPIVGRVSMNLTTVDVTAIPEAAEGDEVVLLGNAISGNAISGEGISAVDHARIAGTIPYEILCGVRTSE